MLAFEFFFNAFLCSLVHLWRYRGGYPALNDVMSKLKKNKVTDFKGRNLCHIIYSKCVDIFAL